VKPVTVSAMEMLAWHPMVLNNVSSRNMVSCQWPGAC
jgi:hypothetical protein